MLHQPWHSSSSGRMRPWSATPASLALWPPCSLQLFCMRVAAFQHHQNSPFAPRVSRIVAFHRFITSIFLKTWAHALEIVAWRALPSAVLKDQSLEKAKRQLSCRALDRL